MPESVYATVYKLLRTKGVAVLCVGTAPANAANLFDLLMSRGKVSVQVDDAFIVKMERHAAED